MIDKPDCMIFRIRLKAIADNMMSVRDAPGPGTAVAVPDEAIANFMLACRHLEDASMRLDKCIQALDGGVSVYDKDQVPAVREPAPMCPRCGRNPLYQGHCGLCGYDVMNG